MAGDLDSTFGDGGILRTSLGGSTAVLRIPSDGRILMAGAEPDALFVAPFRSDGTADPALAGGVARFQLDEAAVSLGGFEVLSDGRLLLGGSAGGRPVLLRAGPDGALDPTFGDGGIALDDRPDAPPVADLAVDAQGRIVVAGGLGDRGVLARYEASGAADTRFGDEGIAVLPRRSELERCSVGTVIVQRDGSIVAGGSCIVNPPSAGLLVHLSPDAHGEAQPIDVDPVVRIVLDLVVRHDDRFAFTSADPARIALFEPDGAPVATFGSGGLSPYVPGAYAGALAVDASDRPVATGFFVADPLHPVAQLAVVRFTADGSPDRTFGEGGLVVTSIGAASQGTAVAVQPDGRIVVAAVVDGQLTLLRYLGDGG